METETGLAAELAAARRGRYTIPGRRVPEGALSLEAAYELAQDLDRERLASGWHWAGWKLGFTNHKRWSRLGLDRPICARIYRETLCGRRLAATEFVQPRIEPEVVFGLGADIAQGADVAAIAVAVEWVAAGLEVVQCHFQGWEMTPAEAVVDAGVHAALAIGPRKKIDAAAVRGLSGASCELLRDRVVVATGRGADVLGGPLHALHWLVMELPRGLQAGEIVTTGTLTSALPITADQRWQHRLTAPIAIEPVELELT